MAAYRKLLVALIGAALAALDQFFGIGTSLDAEKILSVVIPLLTAVGVWATPNTT